MKSIRNSTTPKIRKSSGLYYIGGSPYVPEMLRHTEWLNPWIFCIPDCVTPIIVIYMEIE